MASYNLKIKVRVTYLSAAKNFFSFLQVIGRKYPKHIKLKYRDVGRGYLHVVVEGAPESIDAFFQELILNKGLYYYVCSIEGAHKDEIVRHVVIPIFQALLENRFENPYSHFLKRHILGKINGDRFFPGEFKNKFSHNYEILFRKWDVGLMDDWNFIKDIDSLLTQFMLTQIGHIPGKHSPNFNHLVEKAQKRGIGLMDEVKDKFIDIHNERTNGLHRLKISLTKEDISVLAFWVYNYFQFFDDFTESQNTKTEKLHNRRYRRIRYGNEVYLDVDGQPYKDENGELYDQEKFADKPCHDCAAIRGQLHCMGCDVEQCPRCKHQFISCSCKLQKDYK